MDQINFYRWKWWVERAVVGRANSFLSAAMMCESGDSGRNKLIFVGGIG